MTLDPNMRCVCGYRRFREDQEETTTTVEQWVRYDSGHFGGVGVTPVGTTFGGGVSGGWGRFPTTVKTSTYSVVCENCQRVRTNIATNGLGIYGWYVLDGAIYIYVTDNAAVGCLRLRFTSVELGVVVDVSPTPYYGTPQPLELAPPLVTGTEPIAGEPVAQVLVAYFPDVDHDGDFVVSLADVCGGTETTLTTVTLESAVQIHSPNEAELDMPRRIVELNTSINLTTAQPGSGSLQGIPFDRCVSVVEYDARLGTMPSVQGWTHAGIGSPSDFSVIEGGVLNMATAATSYWEKVLTLGSALSSVYLAAKYRVLTSAGGYLGLDLRGDLAPGASSPYAGVRALQDPTGLYLSTLNGVTLRQLDTRLSGSWSKLFMGAKVGTTMGVSMVDDGPVLPQDVSLAWNTEAGGGVNPTLRARFGDYNAGGLTAQLRNIIVSAPGRFMRAYFRSYAAVAAPVLRLYFVADIDGSPSNRARIRVRYGTLANGVSPYDFSSGTTIDTTAVFTAKNKILELPVTLAGLSQQAPFWFSVERDWTHSDDAMGATAHLLSATVRSS